MRIVRYDDYTTCGVSLLAAAVNLARLGTLGLRRATGQGWQVAPA